MNTLRKHLELLRVQLKASALLSLQYRMEAFGQALMTVLWIGAAVVPLLVLFEQGERPAMAGWSFWDAMLVVAFFTAFKGLLGGLIQPSLQSVVEHIRKGTFDLILLKPADAQFLASTSKIDMTRAVDLIAAVGLCVLGLVKGASRPSVGALLSCALIAACGALILYSIFVMVISMAFWVVKIDNLGYLIASAFDAARWPASIFKGVAAFILTFVLPLAVITTWPAEALLGRLEPQRMLWALALAATFGLVSRGVWRVALGRYTSAGG